MKIISKYFNITKIWCNKNSGFLSSIFFLTSICMSIIWEKIIALIILSLLMLFGLWIFIKHKWSQINKTIIYTISVLSALVLFWIIWIASFLWKPEILDIANGSDVVIHEKFHGWNFKNNFNVIDDQFVSTENDSKTLKSSSHKKRAYTIFTDLTRIKGDKFLFWKFRINWPSRVGFRLMNKKTYDSNEILEGHLNECVITSYGDGKVKEWYSHYIHKRGVDERSSFEKTEIKEGVYYLLLKLSWWKISCYFQKEWNKNYKEIIVNQDIIFEHLWWPVMTRYIDDPETFPEVLEFNVYIKE